MRRGTAGFCGLAACVAMTLASAPSPRAEPSLGGDPAARQPIGALQLVARVEGEVAGIAVTPGGRIFVTFPRHDSTVRFTVAELVDGTPQPYPDARLNAPDTTRPGETLFSVQNLRVDGDRHLWLLDSGFLLEGSPPVHGAPKLVEIDLVTDRVIRTIVLPPAALDPKSALKDLRIDHHVGRDGTIFITDNAYGGGRAFIVVDLASGRAVRRMVGDETVEPPANVQPIVGSRALQLWKPGATAGRPFARGLNRIGLSADGHTLFFSAFTSRHLYALSADALADPNADDHAVRRSLRDLGEVGMSSHIEVDRNDRVYVCDLEHDAVFRIGADGKAKETLAADPRLVWPDTEALAQDQYLYITTSQHDLRPELWRDGVDRRRRPFGLYRLFVGSAPIP